MAEREPPRMSAASGGGAASAGAATGQSFFDRGDRRTHLEQLRHLSQWSRRVLLVTGPRGVGKSMLFRQLSSTLEPRAKAARISGGQARDSLGVLSAMVQGFGLAAPADAGARLLRELIGDHAESQQNSERFCVALVDDADQLEPKALESLLELAAASPMRLVLFGEVRLVPAIERLAESRGVEWHEIRLTGFGLDDVRGYVEWRLRAQGHEGPVPFTEAQIREIARLSEGLPGRIDQMTNVLLARIRSAGHGPSGRRFPPLPDRHRIVLAALVLVLGFAWILWPSADDAPAPTSATETLVVPPPLQPRTEEVAAPRTTVDEALEDLAGAETRSGAEPDPVAEPAADVAPTADPPVGPAPVAEEASRREDPRPETAPVAESAEGAGVVAADGESAVGETPPPEQKPAPEPPTRDTAAAAAGPATSAAGRGAAWILQQPDSAFTLQLVSFSSADRLAEYLAEQADAENFASFRLQRDGRILHVVIYGRFDDRAAAAAAASSLPASVGRVEPWVRTFGQVQEGVRTALQP